VTRSPLDLDEPTMRRLGHRAADIVARHLSTIRDEPVIAGLPRRELSKSLARQAPRDGVDFEKLISTLEENVFPYHAREPHPGFLAYVSSCPTFPSLVGDWIATGYDFFAGVWPVATGPNEIEVVVLDWFREWTGMPVGSSGILTTGGSAANLTAVVAARHAAVEAGNDISRLTVYTSPQAHSSVTRAAWIAGISRDNVRSVEMDSGFRIKVSDLRRAVAADTAAGLSPFMVLASAGTTNTGSVDPLHEIADFCIDEKLWLHVDAAYAGFAVLTEEGKRMLSGLERADSLTLDPHKWLFVPFECGCLMVRNPAKLTAAFRILPEYLKDVQPGDEEINFADRGEQLTRYSRALKVWMSVNYFGTKAFADEIQLAMERARLLEQLVKESEDFEILSPAQFGIVCFRGRARGETAEELDALNERINTRVVSEGRFLISSTRLNGAFSLRICTLGFRTTMDDIREFFHSVKRALAVERSL
jgi:glutamate/tyrosine decarboxylase-like PLP-dependent enzyme